MESHTVLEKGRLYEGILQKDDKRSYYALEKIYISISTLYAT